MSSQNSSTRRRPPTFDHLKSKKKPVTRSVPVPMDPELAEAHAEAAAEVERLKMRLDALPEHSPLRGEVAEHLVQAEKAEGDAKKKLEPSVVWFKFRSIGSRAYDDLVKDHPPTEEENKEHLDKFKVPAPYDAKKFAPALISASLLEPQLTVDQVEELMADDAWNGAEIIQLWQAANEVNTTRRVVELGKGRG